MNVYVYYVCGTLLLALVAPSFIFTLGACEESQAAPYLVAANSTRSGQSKVAAPPKKSPKISERPSFQAAALQSKEEQATTVKDERATSSAASGIVPAVVHPSFAETVVVSTDNDKQEELRDSNSLSPELPTEVSNGLTDTGQAVLATLGELESTQRQTGSVGLALDPENLTGLLQDAKSHWLEPPQHDNASDAATTEANVRELLQGVDVAEELAVPLEDPVARGEDNVEVLDSATPQAPDDIPSFSEWAQKQLEEAEKKKAVHNATVPVTSGVPLKLRSKNYASPDCGAKIAGANPEAVSASSVLSPSRDEYLLNACTNRVWFIVELCDSIQAKKIDIANFELFSSSPKDISVSVSDRFPSRDWRSVGQFTANDVRDVQSYNLHPHLFGKFVKVEIHSHYGAEHFCPVSMLRVYGTSEFEVLETEDDAHATHAPDDEDEGSLNTEELGEQPRNLYGIARDAVKSIVKAAEALVIRGEPTRRQSENATSSHSLSTPSHLVVCKDCNDTLFQSVYGLISQRETQLTSFVRLPFVTDALRSGPICVQYGIDFGRRRVTTYPLRHDPGDYLSSLFPPYYMAALCNALAVIEKKVVLNTSHALNNVSICNHPGSELEGFIVAPKATCSVEVSQAGQPQSTVVVGSTTSVPTSSLPSEEAINPTKTFEDTEAGKNLSEGELVAATVEEPLPATQIYIPVEPPLEIQENVTTEPAKEAELDTSNLSNRTDVPEEVVVVPVEELMEEEVLETLLTDVELKELDAASNPILTPTATSASMPPQKESVFVRLSNRLKALERNMSLSGQYLEELSRRYKRQVEEMSRTLNRTLAAVETDTKKREEREKRADDEVAALRSELAALGQVVSSLMTERDGWRSKAAVVGQHLIVIVVEVLVFVVVWYCCRQLPSWDDRAEGRKWSLAWGKKPGAAMPTRRKSVEGVSGHCSPTVRRKRPSEVALNITGTYSELLITESPMAGVDGVWSLAKTEPKRRKQRRKKDLFSRSSAVLLQKPAIRKSSVNGHTSIESAVKEIAVRRASLSELSSISIPANGVQRDWNESLEVPREGVQEMRTSELQVPSLGVQESSENVINVVPKPRTKESLGDSVNDMTHKRNGSYSKNGVGIPRRLSSPSFMRTALSSRAKRQSSEEPALMSQSPVKLKSDNWEFWHSSRKSSQMSLVPSVTGGSTQPGQVSDNQSTRKKAGGGLKKIVKRFF